MIMYLFSGNTYFQVRGWSLIAGGFRVVFGGLGRGRLGRTNGSLVQRTGLVGFGRIHGRSRFSGLNGAFVPRVSGLVGLWGFRGLGRFSGFNGSFETGGI